MVYAGFIFIIPHNRFQVPTHCINPCRLPSSLHGKIGKVAAMIQIQRKNGITTIEMPQMRIKTDLISRHKFNVLRKKPKFDMKYLEKVFIKCMKQRKKCS